MAKCVITIKDGLNGQVIVKTDFIPDLNLEDDGKHLTYAQQAAIRLINFSLEMGHVDEKNVKIV